MSTKPILFHDIDGLLFGEYDGEFQLRPGVKTWLKWAHEHFEVVLAHVLGTRENQDATESYKLPTVIL